MFKAVIALLCILQAGFALSQPLVTDTAISTERVAMQDTLKHQMPDTANQLDLIDVLKSVFDFRKYGVKRQPNKKIYFSFIPSASAIPGGGTALITSTTAAFYLGNRKTTNLSNISFTPYYNFKSRYGLPVHANIWLHDNDWFISSDNRFMVFPQYTWGLGGNTPEDRRLFVNYKYVRLYETVLRRITPYFFAGIGFDMDYRINITDQAPNINLEQFSGYILGTRSGQNSISAGTTLNLLYDTRNNDLNPLPGVFANAVYRYNSEVFGSSRSWQSLYIDLRKYFSLGHNKHKQNELALWAYYWTTLNSGAPYLDLPTTMWDGLNRSSRGFEINRYRGRGLLDFEAEYRRGITDNGLLGFVIFANANSVTEPNSGQFKYVHAAAGAGIRVKFNKNSNTNIGADYGRSLYSSRLMFSVGEAF